MELIAQSIRDWGFYSFIAVFSAVAVWEGLRPIQAATQPLGVRWLNNFLWLALGWFVLRYLLPFSTVQWAETIIENQWGILQYLALTSEMTFLLGLLALDLGSYFLHALFHKSTVLWRIHAIHHSDTDFDCTTGFRFHPAESIIYVTWRITLSVLIGIDAHTILVYEFWVGLQNSYGHANASLPASLERWLRFVIVTPDLHRIHHSAEKMEGRSNFGILLPWWDRLFHSFLATPSTAPASMKMGLGIPHQESRSSVLKQLISPFSKRLSDHT